MAETTIKDGYAGGSDNQLKINPDGSINVDIVSGTTVSGQTSDVDIHDSAGNNLTSTNGALNVYTSGNSSVTGTVTSNTAGLTAFQTSQYTIGTTAIQLAPAPLMNRSSVSITITAAANIAVYIGNSNSVTTTTGYPLYNGSTIQLDLTPAGSVWAISSTTGPIVAVLEIA